MTTVGWTWKSLLATCKRLHEICGPDIEIPANYQPDVIQVFDDVEIHVNIFRFVTYILWLEQQPKAFEKYLHVKLNRPDLWAKSFNYAYCKETKSILIEAIP